MYCTNCGQKLEYESRFCTACGAKQTDEATKQSALNQIVLMRQIIGKNADYYLAAFQRITQTGKSKMNWAAFFLNVWHASYRGVWREWLKSMKWVLIGILSCWILASILFYIHPIAGIVLLCLGNVMTLVLAVKQILFAKQFNQIYKQHIEAKIACGDNRADPSGIRVVKAYLISVMVYIVVGIFLTSSLMMGSVHLFFKDKQDFTIVEDVRAFAEEEAIVDVPQTTLQTVEDIPAVTADISSYVGDWVNAQTGKPRFTITSTADGNYEIAGCAVYQEGSVTVSIAPTPLFVSGATATAQYTVDNWGGSGTITLQLAENGFYATVTATAGNPWSMEMEQRWFTRNSDTGETAEMMPNSTEQIEEELDTLYSDYLNGFIDAVNTGDFSRVAYTMKPSSTIYTQQQSLISNLSNRGVREEAMSCSIQNRYLTSETQAEIVAEEGIQVVYPDGTIKIISQTYTYLAEKDKNGNWLLVNMIEQRTSSTDITE